MGTSDLRVFVAVCKEIPSGKSTDRQHALRHEQSGRLLIYSSANTDRPGIHI
jgi:hypothetical protein